MAKCYRMGLAGRIPTAEMARLVYALDRIRTSIESEAAVPDPSTFMTTTEINVYAIPHGVQFSSDGQTLVWPETGAPADPLPFTPATPSHDWTKTALPAPDAALEPIAEQLMVEVDVADDPKITVLRPWRERDDPPGAA